MLSNFQNISAYGVCGAIGFLLGMVYLAIIAKIKKSRFDDLVYVYVWSAIGAIVGAKVLYLLIGLPDMISIIRNGNVNITAYFAGILSGGFVFYGGLIGAIVAMYISSRYFNIDFNTSAWLITPAMPIAHAFGRIGCAIVGCCYGAETSLPIGIVYSASAYAPNGVRLLPIQLIEATLDIVIFVFLMVKIIRSTINCGYFILNIYLTMYAVMRFILEFCRGDAIRGHIGFFSTSQWISVFILTYIIICAVRNTKKSFN